MILYQVTLTLRKTTSEEIKLSPFVKPGESFSLVAQKRTIA